MFSLFARPMTPLPDIASIVDSLRGKWASVLDHPERYRLQAALSVLSEHRRGHVTMERTGYRADAEYFYPASTIKLGAAVAALELLEQLRTASGFPVGPNSPITLWPRTTAGRIERVDPSNNEGGLITVAHEVRKTLLISDNEAFNRLYDLVGHRELNEALWRRGLRSTCVNHRLAMPEMPLDEHRKTPQVSIETGDRRQHEFTIPERASDLMVDNSGVPGLKVGVSHVLGGKRFEGPMHFLRRNRMALVDLQNLLVLIVRPDAAQSLGLPPLKLDEASRHLLADAMTQYPRLSANPRVSEKDYPDEWGKLFLKGLTRVVPKDELTITNKFGQAYGFMIENAYVEAKDRVPFFLSTVMYTNASEIVGGDRYEYDSIAKPFFDDLAEAVARAVWKI